MLNNWLTIQLLGNLMSNYFSAESLRGITNFVVTAQARSFTEAAEILGITKSAVGKSIARTEERLGVRLFHRSTRKLSLTSDGEAYLASCLSALEILEATENILCYQQENPSGIVRIDMPTSFGRNLMMPILIELSQQYPQLRFNLTFNDCIIDPIVDGFDLVLRFGELQNTDELIVRRLSRQRLYVCASPLYIEKSGQPNSIEDLHHHLCLMGYRRGGPLPWRLKNNQGNEIRFSCAQSHQISDGDAMLDACLAGMGIAQFPEMMINHYLKSGRLIQLMADFCPMPADLYILWPRMRQLNPRLRVVVNELVKKANDGYFGLLS